MVFYYTARSSEGHFLRGWVEAFDFSDALAILRSRNIIVTALERAGSAAGTIARAIAWAPLSRAAVVTFFRSLATLVRAGVPLRRSLTVCAQACRDARLRETLQSVCSDIDSGASLSDAFKRRPGEFSALMTAMTAAGEQGGMLDDVLDRLASALERDDAMRKRVRAALTYPAIVALVSCAVFVLLLTTVIPVFGAMYQQLNVRPPWILTMAIFLNAAIHGRLATFELIGTVFVCASVIAGYTHTASGRSFMEHVRLRLPVAGPILRKVEIARTAQMLGTLLRCGVTLSAALPLVADVSSLASFARAIRGLALSIEQGGSIGEQLGGSQLFDGIFLQLVRVGEETGNLDTMLQKIAGYYELDVETSLQTLGAAVEPLLIVVLGGGVALIAAAIFLPLYTLIGNIR